MNAGGARLMVLDDPIEWTKLIASSPGATRFLADPEGMPFAPMAVDHERRCRRAGGGTRRAG